MYLDKIHLTHFRGATELTLDLDPKLNVFYGANGAGKSTILDAAAIGLSWLANRIRTERASGKPIREIDIQNGKSHCSIQICGTHSQTSFSVCPVKLRRGHAAEGIRTELALRPLVEEIRKNLSTNERQGVPILPYYPVNRAVLDIPIRIRKKHEFGSLDALNAPSAANFREFFEWFRNREDIENEINRIRPKFIDLQLDAVRSVISVFMPDFKGLTVRRSRLRMEVEKNGKILRVEQLSDGEKCLMALIGDIARRLAIANPNSPNPLEGEGVVLIDEIDLHLHPTWQQMVIPRLGRTFPNCQFLISTHSPHVINHVPPCNLFSLTMHDGVLTAAEHPRESYGKSTERILLDNMGMKTTRPESVAKELDDIYAQIDAGKLDEAKKKIETLRKKIGSDPELVRSSALIKRKELTGK